MFNSVQIQVKLKKNIEKCIFTLYFFFNSCTDIVSGRISEEKNLELRVLNIFFLLP